MSFSTVVGFSGNITRPSKTRGFVEYVSHEAARLHGLSASVYDIDDLGPSLATARWAKQLDGQALEILNAVVHADLLVVGSPTYKGSYTGLLKHFFDLLDPTSLRGKPVILTATGGGERHSLVVEHQLRPLFGFFEAFALPTAVYAVDRDFSDGVIAADHIKQRVVQAVAEAGRALASDRQTRLAAE